MGIALFIGIIFLVLMIGLTDNKDKSTKEKPQTQNQDDIIEDLIICDMLGLFK